jgi:lipoprotein-anchoring transpeptidase ErfK/SrfK
MHFSPTQMLENSMPRLSAAAKAAVIALFLSGFGTATAGAGIDIYIDKSSQRMSVAVDGVHRYTWKVSTGKRRYETPSGTFQPFRMESDHFSTEWDDAPMPNSIFFTYQGHAIHGSPNTRRLGRAASHGCVRLAPQDAAMLYSLVGQKGMGNTRIVILEGGMADAGEIY